jgi:hypothetical protein
MRKKSGNSSQPTPQVKRLIGGLRTPKQQGELGELAFLHKAADLGFGVAKPYGDSAGYDFILDSGERFWRVQVKSIYKTSRHGYQAKAQRCDHSPYTAEQIDFLVAYVVPRDIWYVIPVDCISVSTSLGFYPSGCRRNSGRYEAYREAWHLMAPGADLPEARILRRGRTLDLHGKKFVE